MIDWSSCEAVEQDLEQVSGAWVFRGTRVPVSALFENLKDGASMSELVLDPPLSTTLDEDREDRV